MHSCVSLCMAPCITGSADVCQCCTLLMQKEAKRFLGALAKRCQLAGRDTATAPQLYALADDLELAVPDMEAFLGELNDAGARTPSLPKTKCILKA